MVSAIYDTKLFADKGTNIKKISISIYVILF